jgi:type 1 glutamine amidotransferase
MDRRGVLCYVALAILAFAPLQASAGQAGSTKLKAVLWIGGFAHDFEAIARILSSDLPKLAPIQIQVVRDGSFLDGPEAGQLDLILMNHCYQTTEGVLTDAQKGKLLEMVRSGVGVVALHASYYSFLDWDPCHELYGARFVKHGSSDVDLAVTIVDREHPITKGLARTFEARSELYQSTPLAEDCHVLAKAKEKGTTAEYPSVWTRPYGKGRVVTILPAHWPDAYRGADFQKLIAASALWAARRLDETKQEKENR